MVARRPALLLRLVALAAFVLVSATPAPASAASGELRAGVGRADMTPPTGYPFGGWVRADRTGNGAQGRLWATAIVLERDGRRVALVSAELFAVFAPMIRDVAKLAGPGWAEENILVSASHTHAGPAGFAPYDTYNTIAPSAQTADRPQTFAEFFSPQPVDERLYTFLVRRMATAIRQATAGLRPAAAGWGVSRLEDVTRNRSVEAHLHNHGIVREPRQGSASEDPEGVVHTIDPEVSVLRIDRVVRRVRTCRRAKTRRTRRRCVVRVRIPIGGWSMFANHGTVNPSDYEVYNQDHHGHASAVFEAGVRREGRTSPKRMVVNVFGSGNEGDQSAGLGGQGPEVAARVGRREGEAMLEAWRSADRNMSRKPALDVRWTRVCFCGQEVEGGRVGDGPVLGVPFLTGSEEGRGPLHDITQQPLEGTRDPSGFGSQGHKVAVTGTAGDVPPAVPIYAVRVAERMVVSLPAEPTVEVGRRAKAAVMKVVRGSGVESAVVTGLAGEFIQYLTTPEEYDRQHYEGGSTLFGRLSAVLMAEQLGELAGRLTAGREAQAPAPAPPTNGAKADAEGFGTGAREGRLTDEPAETVAGGGQIGFGWRGGPRGLDRPLDDPFVTVQRRDGERWVDVEDDRDLRIVWRTDNAERYTATWDPPRSVRPGTHRFVVTANHFRLVTGTFAVTAR